MYDEMAQLLDDVSNKVDFWTDHTQWKFEAGSPAADEVANVEVKLDGSPWGNFPVRTAYQTGQMHTMFTVEMARCIAQLLRGYRAAVGVEVLTRASLEAASAVWWLFEPDLTARQRVCRMQLLQRKSALEMERVSVAIGEDPSGEDLKAVESVENYGHTLGLDPFRSDGKELEGESLPSYSTRVKKFTEEMGFEGAYNIYSAVAHAELAGVWRLLQKDANRPDGEVLYTAGPNPRLTFSAVQGALKAMMGPMERIVHLFGWTAPGWSEDVGQLIDYINAEMKRLRLGMGS